MADMLPVMMIVFVVGTIVEELLIVATLLILLRFSIEDNLGADEGGVYQDQENDDQLKVLSLVSLILSRRFSPDVKLGCV